MCRGKKRQMLRHLHSYRYIHEFKPTTTTSHWLAGTDTGLKTRSSSSRSSSQVMTVQIISSEQKVHSKIWTAQDWNMWKWAIDVFDQSKSVCWSGVIDVFDRSESADINIVVPQLCLYPLGEVRCQVREERPLVRICFPAWRHHSKPAQESIEDERR